MSLTNENIKKSFLFYIAILQLPVATWATFVIEGGTFKMKLIPLSSKNKCRNNGKYFALVDDDDFEYLNKFKWFAKKACNTFYAGTNIPHKKEYKIIFMHRLLMGCKKGDGKYIDHKDRNGLNNQKNNLRFCTIQQNNSNCVRKKTNKSTSKYRGVSIHIGRNFSKTKNKVVFIKPKYKAQIQIFGKGKSLGYFKNEIDAARAYNEGAKKYHGEFAILNIIE